MTNILKETEQPLMIELIGLPGCTSSLPELQNQKQLKSPFSCKEKYSILINQHTAACPASCSAVLKYIFNVTSTLIH